MVQTNTCWSQLRVRACQSWLGFSGISARKRWARLQAMTDLDMLAQVRTWVECETPTRDIEGLTRLAGMNSDGYAALGAMVETIEGRDGHGPHPVSHLPAASPCGNCRILILSHIAPVHPRRTQQDRKSQRQTSRP